MSFRLRQALHLSDLVYSFIILRRELPATEGRQFNIIIGESVVIALCAAVVSRLEPMLEAPLTVLALNMRSSSTPTHDPLSNPCFCDTKAPVSVVLP